MLSDCFAYSGCNKLSNLIIASIKSENAQTKVKWTFLFTVFFKMLLIIGATSPGCYISVSLKVMNKFVIQDDCFRTRLKISPNSLMSLFNSVLPMMFLLYCAKFKNQKRYVNNSLRMHDQNYPDRYFYTPTHLNNAVSFAVVQDDNNMVEAEAVGIYHARQFLSSNVHFRGPFFIKHQGSLKSLVFRNVSIGKTQCILLVEDI
uniref:Uncharacterized protein n=1 Tax=Glossina palpalis gambiensis TaxID=67801 RepID=A0A1B0BZQ0_9MUSC